MLLLRRPSPIAYASLFLLLAACGGSVASGGSGVDGGKPPTGDARADVIRDDASLNCDLDPIVGEACSPEKPACHPVIEACCPSYVWACSSETATWTQEGDACHCAPDASRMFDASTPDTSTTEVPTNHRPDDSECATAPPAGDCQNVPDGMCSSDSDCTDGTNGRCNESSGGALFCSCQYDACTADTDCPMGQLCACHESPYTGGDGNTCVQGNCRVDSDCGTNGYCSPSAGGGCGGLSGYYCHTASDTCVNDSDCEGGGAEDCQYSTTDLRWECTMELLCG
jgi:hypothetical protein